MDYENLHPIITKVIQQTDETGKTVWWKPELDDEVILNMAPSGNSSHHGRLNR
nr:hypothetical protein [uncultured Methanospirillum sp.]